MGYHTKKWSSYIFISKKTYNFLKKKMENNSILSPMQSFQTQLLSILGQQYAEGKILSWL